MLISKKEAIKLIYNFMHDYDFEAYAAEAGHYVQEDNGKDDWLTPIELLQSIGMRDIELLQSIGMRDDDLRFLYKEKKL